MKSIGVQAQQQLDGTVPTPYIFNEKPVRVVMEEQREEIIAWIRQGHTNVMLSAELGVAVTCVRTHLARVVGRELNALCKQNGVRVTKRRAKARAELLASLN